MAALHHSQKWREDRFNPIEAVWFAVREWGRLESGYLGASLWIRLEVLTT
jgi:hypothetical protein